MNGAEEDRKRAARAEQVALFRYQLVREAADPALSTRQRGRMVREIASKAHEGPFGDPVTVSRGTIDRWIRAWPPRCARRWPPAASLPAYIPITALPLSTRR